MSTDATPTKSPAQYEVTLKFTATGKLDADLDAIQTAAFALLQSLPAAERFMPVGLGKLTGAECTVTNLSLKPKSQPRARKAVRS